MQEVKSEVIYKKPESKKQAARGFTLVPNGKVREDGCYCCANSSNKTYETKSPEGDSFQVCQMCLRDNLIC